MLPKTGLSALGTFSPLGVNFTPANQKSENMASQQIKYLGTEPLFFHFRGRTSLTNMFLNGITHVTCGSLCIQIFKLGGTVGAFSRTYSLTATKAHVTFIKPMWAMRSHYLNIHG
jgi:hypothetical protein